MVRTNMASISVFSSSRLQRRGGASQKSLYVRLIASRLLFPASWDDEEDSNFLTKSENDFLSSEGAAGCGCTGSGSTTDSSNSNDT